MSITTFNELKAAIASWLARSDLTDQIPDFITLFENHACRELLVEDVEEETTLSPSSGSVALPSDFLSVRALTWEGYLKRDLVYLPPSELTTLYAAEEEGAPLHYTIKAGNIIIRPISDEDLTLLYRARTDAVSTTLNWLFTKHPDAYLNGALFEAHKFIKDFEGAAPWKSERDAIFDSIKGVNFKRRGTMHIRVDGPTP
jgi:hypothetical protein